MKFRMLILASIILIIITSIANPTQNIQIPITAHIISESSGYYTSSRDETNIYELFEDVNRIWSQAEISFYIVDIISTEVNADTIPNTLNGNRELIALSNKQHLNIYFAQSLNGINGIALVGTNSALVADHTTVNDFRTTAHEIGHLFGLKHVSSSNSLMARGKNGELLSQDEINFARERLNQ